MARYRTRCCDSLEPNIIELFMVPAWEAVTFEGNTNNTIEIIGTGDREEDWSGRLSDGYECCNCNKQAFGISDLVEVIPEFLYFCDECMWKGNYLDEHECKTPDIWTRPQINQRQEVLV